MDRTLRLSPIADLDPLMGKGEIVAFNVGPDRLAYLVFAKSPLDYRRTAPNGCSFAKTIPDQPQTYRVIALDGNDLRYDVEIRSEKYNIHDVQPLPANELLLVCCRSYYRDENDYDKNGRVYTRDGTFARELLLGDGIQTVQATDEGIIWTSYFDEGVFGNYGWNEPVGAAGLIAWDANGNKHFEYRPAGGLDFICDCYALNVASNGEVWCYYYTQFPLVRIRNGRIDESWKVPVHGSDAFAVANGFALFRGGYEKKRTYYLVSLHAGSNVERIARVRLEDEEGETILPDRIVARGDAIYLLNGSKLYRVDVGTVAA